MRYVFQLFAYQRQVLTFSVAGAIDQRAKKVGIVKAREKLLKSVEDNEDLEMSSSRMCEDESSSTVQGRRS